MGSSEDREPARKPIRATVKGSRPHSIKLTNQGLVDIDLLDPQGTLPVVIRPTMESADLPSWARHNLSLITTYLLKHGAVLFRGFPVGTQSHFEAILESLAFELMHYAEGATPRTRLSDKVYTSTEFPPDHSIALHNELSYVTTWPMKICLFCVQPAEMGGATPIADVRRVLARIDPDVRDLFGRKGWMLVRNFSEHLSLPWQSVYRTAVKSELEDYCRRSSIEFEWLERDRLRTRQVRPALARHPMTGDLVWFNHIAFWHIASLEPHLRSAITELAGEAGAPYHTYYGDGTPIEESVIAHLRDAYHQETVEFPWQVGDLLLLDNMLVAHGRRPYVGPRRILVGMGEPCSNRGL